MKSSIHLRTTATSRKRCPLDSSTSTGISGDPKVAILVNTPRAGNFSAKVQTGLLSTESNMRPSVVMQQNDLPTSLSSKWSFLSHSIEQINRLTTVVLGSNRLTQLKELTKQHTLRVPPDAQKDFFGVSVWLCRGCCWRSGVYP
uniref:E3 ubiquitin-protein ligase HERC2 n=1 Tax=Heterorhabditis bacteriophora TaxID=37862 RepID=A0A1I7XIG0_HETBA